MPGNLHKRIYLQAVNFGAFKNLNIYESLLTCTFYMDSYPVHVYIVNSLFFISTNGIIFTKFT